MVSSLALPTSLQPHLPPVCTLPRPLPSSCLRLSTCGLRASSQAPPLPEAAFSSSGLGLRGLLWVSAYISDARKGCPPQHPVFSLTFSLVSCTFSSWLLSVCSSTIQCLFIPTCPPLQPEGTTGPEASLPSLPLFFIAPSPGLATHRAPGTLVSSGVRLNSPRYSG